MDIRLNTAFFRNAKVRRLQLRGLDYVVGLLQLWCAAADQHPGGVLSIDSGPLLPDEIETLADWRGEKGKLVDALRDERHQFLDLNRVSNTYSLHDWDEHQGWVLHAKHRSEIARANAHARWSKLQTKSKATASMQPHCNPQCSFPSPSPSPKEKERVNPLSSSSSPRRSAPAAGEEQPSHATCKICGKSTAQCERNTTHCLDCVRISLEKVSLAPANRRAQVFWDPLDREFTDKQKWVRWLDAHGQLPDGVPQLKPLEASV